MLASSTAAIIDTDRANAAGATFGPAAVAQVDAASEVVYVDIDLTVDEQGIWLTTADGTVEVRGTGTHHGDRPVLGADERIVELVPTPTGDGYWLFTDAGAVHAFGDAVHHGDVAGLELSGPIVAATVLPDGSGYHLLGSDGGVFALGAARFHGSIPQVVPPGALAAPIVSMTATESGYLLVGADGGTFAFGDAEFHGSVPGVLPGVTLASAVVGIVPGPAGYLMLGGDGGIFNFGVSLFHGSLSGFGAADVVAVDVLADLSGYAMLDADGNVWPFGAARDVAVEESTGTGDATVPFDHDEPVLVSVTSNGAGLSMTHAATSGDVVRLDGAAVAEVVVHAPAITELQVVTTGSWSVVVRPLSYALPLRHTADPVVSTAAVHLLARSPAGTGLRVTGPGGGSFTTYGPSGGDATLQFNGGFDGAGELIVLPEPDGPLIVAVQNGAFLTEQAFTASFEQVAVPRAVEIIGDSVGITLDLNQPSSSRAVLTVGDSSIEGCGLIEVGAMISGGRTRRNFSACVNVVDRWLASIDRTNPEIALVVIGAWEVFDLQLDGAVVPFGSAEHDAVLLDALNRLMEGFLSRDVSVAFLEVPCQFPRPGGGLTPLPERGERWRTDHLNNLIRQAISREHPFNDRWRMVTSPPGLCDDPAIGDNPSIRWDGTHFGPAGGTLVWNHIDAQLLRMR